MPVLVEVFADRNVAEWMEALEPADVLCAPVAGYAQMIAHPQVVASGMIVEQDHPRAGRFKTIATPVRFEKTPGTIRTPAPALGEHTREVLREIGYAEGEIEALGARGIL